MTGDVRMAEHQGRRRPVPLAIGLAVVGVLALVAVIGLLAGCAGQTAGIASAGPDTRVSSPAPTRPTGSSVVRASASPPRSAGGTFGPATSASSPPAPDPVTVTAAPVTTTVVQPPATVTVAAPVEPPAVAGRLPGDLGLAEPISWPACDGSGIVVVKSATTPGAYAAEVQAALDATPGSRYLRTDQTCPSLTPRTPEGDPIYAVYLPAGHTTGSVCSVVASAPEGSYGRWLSYGDSPDHTIDC